MTGVSDAIDNTLELLIAPSFTRIGFDLRKRLYHWEPLGSYDLTGRVAIVTGATSGLGRAAAEQLVACGATVVVIGRDAARTEAAATAIRASRTDAALSTVIADLGDLGQVRDACAEILGMHDRLDVVIHNAGSLDRERSETAAGIETTIASQVVGPFLMTTLLMDRLGEGAPGRVITVSSGGMYAAELTVDHLEMAPERYDGTRQYAIAKRAQVTLNEMWAERVDRRSVVFHAMHPGWADTPGVASSLPLFHRIVGPFQRDPAAGADTMVWLAADDGPPLETSGAFWLDRRQRAIHRLRSTRRSDSAARRDALWQWVSEHATDR